MLHTAILLKPTEVWHVLLYPCTRSGTKKAKVKEDRVPESKELMKCRDRQKCKQTVYKTVIAARELCVKN